MLKWNALMQEGRASRTAERVAMRRAVHQLFDELPLDAEEINTRHFAGRSDRLMVRGGLDRLACAWRQ